MTINPSVKKQVRERANFLCEYCHSSEEASTSRFTIDHWLPRSCGGSDVLENLVLACHRCNTRRYNFTTAIDPDTGKTMPIFNPRTDMWSEHFVWVSTGLKIVEQTSVGRATCQRLDVNDENHDDGSIIKARRMWIRGGWHPPDSDPIR